ncbi:MAG: O-antigen ligase family protein [Thermomicrobiales bacterium]
MKPMDALRTEQSINTSSFVARVLILSFLGYWAFGKAFAYVGLFPLYIGEVLLVTGLLYLIHRGTIPIPNLALFWFYALIFGVVIGQAGYSVLIMGQAPLEVLRNLAIIYYGLFALITYTLIVRSAGSDFYRNTVENLLPRAAPWILAAATLTVIGGVFFVDALPQFPKTDSVTILLYKPTDSVMPLIVLMALWIRGYLKTRWMVWTAGLLAIAAGRSRSAMLAAGVAVLAMIWRPTRRMLNMIALGLVIFVVMLIADVRIDLGYREVSARQFLANFSSLVGSDEAASGLDATTTRNKDWRAAWWDSIYNDAVDNNRYLIGLGWGSNLADEFGFQTEDSDINALRNPHNALLGILARGGWLTASLWVTFYLLLLYGLWQAARAFDDDSARKDMAWVIMIYIVASQINGATDVFLESPQNAIPHWIVVGVAWALIREAQLKNWATSPAMEMPDRGERNRQIGPDGARPAGIPRPVLPVLATQVRTAHPCPALSMASDPTTCGLVPREDHVCEYSADAPAGVDWQRRYCLGDYSGCPYWWAEQQLQRKSEDQSAIDRVIV